MTRVLELLDDADLARDMLLVYTSDPGFLLGDHGTRSDALALTRRAHCCVRRRTHKRIYS